MTKKHTDILILGAGLSGLALAYYLKKHKINALVIDARDRLGGRIHTSYKEGEASVEMGATWFNSGHTTLLGLLEELGLGLFRTACRQHGLLSGRSSSIADAGPDTGESGSQLSAGRGQFSVDRNPGFSIGCRAATLG